MALALNRFPLNLFTAALVFAAVFFSIRAIDGSSNQSSSFTPRASSSLSPEATTDERIGALRADVAADPSDPELHVSLGLAYLTKAGEIADSSFYLKSEAALEEALRRDPANFNANSAMGKLSLAAHDFRAGLRFGERARSINGSIASNYGILTDAHIELGQYGQAERTLQRWVNLKPGLAPYARISYFRELHGDLAGAIEAMKLAVSAGSGGTDFSYVQGLVAKLEFDRGRYGAAEHAYRVALQSSPGNPAAIAGLGAVDAAQGQTDAALRRYRAAARALPVADYPLAIAELHEAAGRDAAAEAAYARAEALIRREIPNGVDVRAELALFEADHGNPAMAVTLARESLPVRPSVTGFDSYAWALHKEGEPRAALAASMKAMKLGSRDPGFLYRAGMISVSAGETARAKRLLGTLLAQSPHFHPLYAPEARAALARVPGR
jgi:tetratricopeptide (TPR) repeat protein